MSETPKTMDYWVAQQIVAAAAVGENKGAIAERERIIKLLEGFDPRTAIGDLLPLLIKGENK